MSKEARWLRDTLTVVANSPPPDIDWSRVEKRVFDRLEAQPAPRLRLVPGIPWKQLSAIAAIAAATALAVQGLATRNDPAPVRATATAAVVSPAAHAGPLRPGDFVAADRDLHFAHRDWATFSLASGSRVAIDRLDDQVFLSLESGSIQVDVQPGRAVGAVVVRAGSTLIAVHGTRFVVERSNAEVTVRVTDGAVSVGANSRQGPTVKWLVAAGFEGRFSLDGAATASFGRVQGFPSAPAVASESGEPPVPAANTTTARSVPVTPKPSDSDHVPSPVASTIAAELPDVLTNDTAHVALAALKSQLTECYRAAALSRPAGVKITVNSSLSLTVAPDGHVVLGQFSPPLKPEARACLNNAVLGAQFPRAKTQSLLQLGLAF